MSNNYFNDFKMPDIKIPDIKIDTPNFRPQIQSLHLKIDEINEIFRSKQEKEERYKTELLQTLKNIEANTVGLNEVVTLLSQSNQKQEEIAELLKEALDIAVSKNLEEAENKWRKVMNKANELTTDVETIQKIHGFANTILGLFQNLPS